MYASVIPVLLLIHSLTVGVWAGAHTLTVTLLNPHILILMFYFLFWILKATFNSLDKVIKSCLSSKQYMFSSHLLCGRQPVSPLWPQSELQCCSSWGSRWFSTTQQAESLSVLETVWRHQTDTSVGTLLTRLLFWQSGWTWMFSYHYWHEANAVFHFTILKLAFLCGQITSICNKLALMLWQM